MSRPDIVLDRPNPIYLSNEFESLMWGDPGVRLDDLRRGYKAIAQHEYSKGRKPPIWTTHPQQIVRCIILGIDPYTGRNLDLTRIDQLVARLPREIRALHQRYMESPFLQRAIEQERVENQSATVTPIEAE